MEKFISSESSPKFSLTQDAKNKINKPILAKKRYLVLVSLMLQRHGKSI